MNMFSIRFLFDTTLLQAKQNQDWRNTHVVQDYLFLWLGIVFLNDLAKQQTSSERTQDSHTIFPAIYSNL